MEKQAEDKTVAPAKEPPKAIEPKKGKELGVRDIAKKFNKLVFSSRVAMFWERNAPRALVPACIAATFLGVSFLGTWAALPLAAKVVGVTAFAAATIASPFFIKSGKFWPSRKEAIKRLDDANPVEKRKVAQTLSDVVNVHEREAEPVWNLHIKRTWERWGQNLKRVKAKPDFNKADPYKMRFIAPIFAIAAGFAAGDQALNRVKDAFDWTPPPAPEVPLQIEAWVTPPRGIDGIEPIYLNQDGVVSDETGEVAQTAFSVHEQSVLNVIVSGRNAPVTNNGVVVDNAEKIEGDPRTTEDDAYHYTLTLGGGETVFAVEGGPSWTFNVAEDNAPSAAIENIVTDPENGRNLIVTCDGGDDYGVREGEIEIVIDGVDMERALPSAQLPSVRIPPNQLCGPK